jgi:threonine dehydrogenase-like Zn-dependent dehydrogenase
MKALIKYQHGITKLVDLPSLSSPKDNMVTIQIKCVGLCRTDLSVAKGLIPVSEDIILGHEFSGIITEDKSDTFSIGQAVVVNPLFPNKKFMGLDFSGALTEYIQVPIEQVVRTNLPFQVSAYIEPVAASMAALKANITKEQKGAVYGNNRIAQLTYLILKSFGYNISLLNENNFYNDNSFDYVIETLFEEEHLTKIINMLKDNGLLIIKSRKKQGVGINPGLLVAKEINMQAVITPLLGDCYPIEQWEEAFKAADRGESKKIFITL